MIIILARSHAIATLPCYPLVKGIQLKVDAPQLMNFAKLETHLNEFFAGVQSTSDLGANLNRRISCKKQKNLLLNIMHRLIRQ